MLKGIKDIEDIEESIGPCDAACSSVMTHQAGWAKKAAAVLLPEMQE